MEWGERKENIVGGAEVEMWRNKERGEEIWWSEGRTWRTEVEEKEVGETGGRKR